LQPESTEWLQNSFPGTLATVASVVKISATWRTLSTWEAHLFVFSLLHQGWLGSLVQNASSVVVAFSDKAAAGTALPSWGKYMII
jgi:hypothetical protein